MAGKGDKYRKVNKKIYDNNFDNIKWSNKNKKKNISKKEYLISK